MGVDTRAAPPFQKRYAIDLREHDIEDDHVVRRVATFHIRFFAVQRDVHSEAFFLKPLPKGLLKLCVVLDEQYAHEFSPLAGSNPQVGIFKFTRLRMKWV